MKQCQKCKSERLAQVQGHCVDSFYMRLQVPEKQKSVEYDGYVPSKIGIGGGDDIFFSYCLDCGQIQGTFPINPPNLDE